ncbi:iron-siderophore ABC transporter permease [Pokkaliibacter plantistimulans]|uniref:Iron-siderophore ABC transporter permease n=1 Tax=Proteobacteria bacterium 228 TaxID=2083153 RepID=A0A2S5KGK4_9PROT|nr:iron ABC transporter permease [Pokkaliibacter plantistimulans]PPC73934.1 iron-siderophore ABC transporter permease [Pokkaliibacter plantistimulans]
MPSNTSGIAAQAANEVGAGRGHYHALVWRRQLILAAMAIALLACLCVDLALGPSNYALADVVKAFYAPEEVSVQIRVVLWEIRMPIALMAIVVGAALSVAGAQMQTILNNPLASPFTLGISAGASFGAALALAFGVALFPFVGALDYLVPINAFIVAMLTAGLIHLVSMRRGVSVQTIVLLGIALVFCFNALLALVQFFASQQAMAAVVFWTMGSLTKATWPKFWITLAILLAVMPIFVKRAWALTAMRLGDAKAESFGVNISRIRLETLLLVSLLAAIPVSFVGTIGFVGLVGPHIARMLIGEDQRFFMPAAALCGALLLSASSIVSKMLIPGTIFPIGVVTSLVGIPFFVSLILSNQKRPW